MTKLLFTLLHEEYDNLAESFEPIEEEEISGTGTTSILQGQGI